jgi:hypothetical protein
LIYGKCCPKCSREEVSSALDVEVRLKGVTCLTSNKKFEIGSSVTSPSPSSSIKIRTLATIVINLVHKSSPRIDWGVLVPQTYIRVPRSPSRKLVPFAIDLWIQGSGLTYSANYSVYHARVQPCLMQANPLHLQRPYFHKARWKRGLTLILLPPTVIGTHPWKRPKNGVRVPEFE